MSRYIDANKIADELSKVPWYEREDEKQAVRMVKEFPPADVVRARHGRWKKSYADHEAFGVRPFFRYCSECHEAALHQYNFCPNCGADMRGDQDA